MTEQEAPRARQSEAMRYLERKPGSGEVKFYEILSEYKSKWFHLYEIQKIEEISQTTAHRWMVKLHEWGYLEKENDNVGKKLRHKYRLTKEGSLFIQGRLDINEDEIGIEAMD